MARILSLIMVSLVGASDISSRSSSSSSDGDPSSKGSSLVSSMEGGGGGVSAEVDCGLGFRPYPYNHAGIQLDCGSELSF